MNREFSFHLNAQFNERQISAGETAVFDTRHFTTTTIQQFSSADFDSRLPNLLIS